MRSHVFCLSLESTKAPEFIDITEQVRECVSNGWSRVRLRGRILQAYYYSCDKDKRK